MSDRKICSYCGCRIKNEYVTYPDPTNNGILFYHKECEKDHWEFFKNSLKERLKPRCKRRGQRSLTDFREVVEKFLKKDHILRRKYIEHLCLTLECNLEELLRDHRNMLSRALVIQAQIMYFQSHGRYYWHDKKEKKP